METVMKIQVQNDAFVVDAALVASLLDLPADDVQSLMRHGQITSTCEKGLNEHEDRFRLSFFYRNRRARLSVSKQGEVLQRSVVDYGTRPPQGARRDSNA
ncbi:MAG: hypothetical protein KDJ72_01335 [Methyloceanibacter sp.]|nr:hypothetical protein [Methyloceanibacter sp.]MCC0058638.1 hypothetical protein [Hyphomicrobiaceae bacterium]